ncbi:TRAP-type C4-dicarboxylate transport system permease small subunit [Paenibacillus endophyticus]|uniref:TRAP-type C4-dicarboxylate transport system permease small subunit n=1 Tax=Paenibacillus endophyticus TaxID=1294268 RepID=A0A7W5CDE6_9BACL|nr:hypothetical protein [Paenibacillus endophyticus]MBB3155645.1 TRAP-type C4-dicarboxylate transport system permease small subunit [Paenibacillus endophyticus]
MSYSITKRISYILILIGVLLIIFGLWKYMPKSFSSQTSDSVIMSIIAKRITFPILGLILTVIGYAFLKFVREIEEEIQLLRNELSRLTKVVEAQGKDTK